MIPFCPTDAFKLYRIACFPPAADEIHFHTSGTTIGRPGVHVMPDTELYDAAALEHFRRALLADGGGHSGAPGNVRKFRFLSLTASPAEAPHSSLLHMIDAAGRAFDPAGAPDYFIRGGTLDLSALRSAINQARADGRPVLLLSTAFALVQCLDSCAGADLCAASSATAARLTLPPGSRIMETGGYKGRTRALRREDLYAGVSALFGLPVSAVINEYGMTEMSSQFYDWPADADDGTRIKYPPPWVRTLALDPVTLAPLPPGEVGALAHIDLANLDSCAFILTADAGRVLPAGGFELFGRFQDADLRGCSLDYEMTG